MPTSYTFISLQKAEPEGRVSYQLRHTLEGGIYVYFPSKSWPGTGLAPKS